MSLTTTSVEKSFPPSPSSERLFINSSSRSELMASLSGKVNDYDINDQPGRIIIHAKKNYQERYRSAVKAETRLEDEIASMKSTLERMEKREEEQRAVLRRSQIYNFLLSVTQDQLYNVIPEEMKNDSEGLLEDLPETFVIWWYAWNQRHPNIFDIPLSMSPFTPPRNRNWFEIKKKLFDRFGRESKVGIVVRRAWEMLDTATRDLMIYCWCNKTNGETRNSIAHPAQSKSEAEEILTTDLYNNLNLHDLYHCAMGYIAEDKQKFKAT